eukprot:12398928-Karenia_brevis.AAC.1
MLNGGGLGSMLGGGESQGAQNQSPNASNVPGPSGPLCPGPNTGHGNGAASSQSVVPTRSADNARVGADPGITKEDVEIMIRNSAALKEVKEDVASVRKDVTKVSKSVDNLKSTQESNFCDIKNMLRAMKKSRTEEGDDKPDVPPTLMAKDAHDNFVELFALSADLAHVKKAKALFDTNDEIDLNVWWDAMYGAKRLGRWIDCFKHVGLDGDLADACESKEEILQFLLSEVGLPIRK